MSLDFCWVSCFPALSLGVPKEKKKQQKKKSSSRHFAVLKYLFLFLVVGILIVNTFLGKSSLVGSMLQVCLDGSFDKKKMYQS